VQAGSHFDGRKTKCISSATTENNDHLDTFAATFGAGQLRSCKLCKFRTTLVTADTREADSGHDISSIPDHCPPEQHLSAKDNQDR